MSSRLLIAILVFGCTVNSADSVEGGKRTFDVKLLNKVITKYRASKGLEVQIQKRTKNEWLTREKISEGRLLYSSGRLRLEINKPDESLLILNGKTIWFVNKLSEDFGGAVLVKKTASANIRKGSSLMAALFSKQDILKKFKIKDQISKDGLTMYSLVPLDPDTSEVTELNFEIKDKKAELEKVGFSDVKNNVTTYQFSNAKFNIRIDKKKFNYVPPKDAEVTEF